MLKLRKNVFIGALTAGLLLGGTALSNVPSANAAASQGSYQQKMGFQAGMGGQGQSNRMNQFSAPMWQQFNQQQFNQQQFNQQQLPGGQYAQGGQMSGFAGGNIVSQVADILDVEEETISEALQDGQTLVEIAEDYDVSEDALLEQLEDLQSEAIDDAVDAGAITDDQADQLKDQLSERLEQIVKGTNTMLNNNVSYDTSYDISISDIKDTLNDYFEDAGDDYFSDDGIDVSIRLSGDEDDLVYTVKLDFSNSDNYEDLTDVSETELESFLNAVESKIKTEIDGTDYEDAGITGKLVDNDNSSYYVKYNGSTYTFGWDD